MQLNQTKPNQTTTTFQSEPESNSNEGVLYA